MDEAQTVDPEQQYWTSIDDGTAAEAIAMAVAEVEGVSPTRLNPPLNDVIDPDVLDRLFAPAGNARRTSAGRVVFPYRGHVVTYHADGYVTVDPAADE